MNFRCCIIVYSHKKPYQEKAFKKRLWWSEGLFDFYLEDNERYQWASVGMGRRGAKRINNVILNPCEDVEMSCASFESCHCSTQLASTSRIGQYQNKVWVHIPQEQRYLEIATNRICGKLHWTKLSLQWEVGQEKPWNSWPVQINEYHYTESYEHDQCTTQLHATRTEFSLRIMANLLSQKLPSDDKICRRCQGTTECRHRASCCNTAKKDRRNCRQHNAYRDYLQNGIIHAMKEIKLFSHR